MTNLKEAFEKMAARQQDTLLCAVIGADDSAEYGTPERDYTAVREPQPWTEAAKKLDYDYDSGFGGAGCHAVIAWGEKFVYYVTEYDGSTSIGCAPRNPQPCAPYWSGVWID